MVEPGVHVKKGYLNCYDTQRSNEAIDLVWLVLEVLNWFGIIWLHLECNRCKLNIMKESGKQLFSW